MCVKTLAPWENFARVFFHEAQQITPELPGLFKINLFEKRERVLKDTFSLFFIWKYF